MNTVLYKCGCFITYSMFGDRQVIDAHLCEQHMEEYPEILKLLAKTILEIQNK